MSTYIEPTDARPTAPSRLWAGGYPTWLVSDTSFELSSALAGFAVPLLALMVTDDPVKAGVIGAAGVGTRVVASLVGGVLADRHNRVRMMLAGAAVGLVIALLFTWAATGSLTFTALLALNVAMAARNGRISFFGGLPKNDPVIACDSNLVHYRQLHIHGANGSSPAHNKRALEYISTGQVPVKDLITRHIPLEQALEAFGIVQRGEAIKVTVEP